MKMLRTALLGAILCVVGAVKAHAFTETVIVYNSSCTYAEMTVSSTTPTRLDSGPLDISSGTVNTLMDFRKYVELIGLNGGTFRLDFSSANLSALVGRPLASSGTATYNIPARDQNGTRIPLWAFGDWANVGTPRKIGITQCGSK